MKFKSLVFYLASTFIIVGASCQQSGINKNVKLISEVDSASYAIGLQVGDNLKANLENVPGGDEINLDILMHALLSTVNGEEPLLSQAEAEVITRDYMTAKAQEVAQANLEEGNAFLENNKTREGVETTDTGLQYEIITEGDGPKPKETDEVKVHYEGSLIDGTVFESSIERGEPIVFPLNGVLPGWTEALQLMPVGSKWKIFIPSNLAYGERGSGQIEPNSTLIFEVELLEIVSSN